MESEFTGRYGRENRMKQGKTFYKGRDKQIARDKNPSQWSAYNKAPRIQHSVRHHGPLSKQLSKTRETGILSMKSLPTIVDDTEESNQNETNSKNINETYLEAKDTDKILKLSKQQIEDHKTSEDPTPKKAAKDLKITKSEELFQIKSSNISLHDLLGDDDKTETESVIDPLQQSNPADIELTQEEEAALEMFMPRSTREQVTLHDIIMKRVHKKEDDNISQLNANKIIERKIPKRVIAVYIDVANILSKWRSGALPKAFKIIPQLQDWEEVLYITNPDKWSPAVVYQGTKLFASQANNSICQRYFNTVLLQRVRDDILLTKKLNFHLYQAVRKALFKPQAFFRGFLLPLCMDECRAREAVILGGVIQKNSIPVIQSALAIYKLLELPFSGPVHYFLKILLNKRYALPMKVIGALVSHFRKFENDPRQMTVIWHQTFLIFAQRYKKSLTKQQRNSLKKVMKKQFHHQITPLVRKELFQNVVDKITSMDIDI